MKFSISINQKSAVDSGIPLDLVDLALIDYAKGWIVSRKAERIITERGEFVWIDYKTTIAEMPMLGIKTNNALARRLNALCENGIFEKEYDAKTSRPFFRFGEKFDLLEWDENSQGGSAQKPRGVDSKVGGGSAQKPNNQDIRDSSIKTKDTSLRSVSLVAEAPQKEESKTKKFLDSIQAFTENGRLESAEYSEVARTVAERMGEDFEKVARELPKFGNYWTQTNENGRKQKWEKEKTFDLVKRFRYWLMNSKDSGRGREKHVSSIVF